MGSELSVLIIGALLGALISSTGYLLRRRTEKKKVFNQSLFSLLEIWSQINKIVKVDPANFVEQLKGYISKKYPDVKFDEKDSVSFVLIVKVFKNLIVEKELSKNNESFEQLFYETIKEISFYSPVLAYELNKEHSIKHILSIIDQYINSISAIIDSNQLTDLNNKKQLITDKLQEKIMKETLLSLENDLKKVAWKGSIRNYYKVKKLLKEKKNIIVVDDTFFDSYIPELIKDVQ